MIDLKGISKIYGQKKVVNDVSVSIAKGKVTSFIGPNGAGKSTLLSMITRLLDQDSGEVLLEGKNILQAPSDTLAKKIAILKQSNHMDLKITVRELIPVSAGFPIQREG